MTQQGLQKLRLDSADGKPLDFSKDKTADKILEYPIYFPNHFAAAPLVQLGITGVQSVSDSNTNWRPDLNVMLSADGVRTDGFLLRAVVGRNNTAYSVLVSWLAISD